MIYFDNGATSYPKPKGMTAAMEECILKYCGNPGRSGHYMSMKTGEEVYEARKKIAKVFGIKEVERLIFTKNTTEALNLGIIGFLNEGDHVITTSMEHNSVLRPLKSLEKKGITHTIVSGDAKGLIKPEQIQRKIRDNTKLIITTHASNVTGTILDIKEIGRIARENNITYMVDGAQSSGNCSIDVSEMGIDMLGFPGHKGLLGPLGTGGLYVSPNTNIRPLLCGGTGTESKSRIHPCDMPEGFEAGTVNAPAIIGLGFSAEYVNKIGVEAIGAYERELISRFENGIRNIKKVQVYGPKPTEKTGICLFNIEGFGCEDVTAQLNNDYGIAVRGGYHCAGLAHKTIGTWDQGAVRLSVGPFNTKREIDYAIEVIWRMCRM